MTGWFRRLPIRSKLLALMLATSLVVALLASVGQLIAQYNAAKRDAEASLRAQADLILFNAAAAISFNNEVEAQETIDTLRSSDSIRLACLYDTQQRLFAQFRHADAGDCPPAAPADDVTFSVNGIHATVSSYDEKHVRKGTIHLRSDIAALHRRFRDQAIIVITVMLIAFGVAVLLSASLQALVSQPIVDLSRTASAVASAGDYSMRAVRRTEDEVGVLVDAFNGMLERIQLRESDLSRFNEELTREIAERRRAEAERAELLVREREANRLKDEFLATLSHELRTPLNAILGWTKLLRGRALPPEATDRALEKVERNAQAQTRLVEDLLEVSRITTGKLRLEVRAIDLVTLTATAIESIRPAAEARGVSLEREFMTPTLPTAGDPDRLQQVIWNLLSNAVKFTPPGGAVRVLLRRAGDVDEVVVEDTGVGIAAEFLPHVFDTFRQADASATRAHGGLGLGLAIVKHLVELHRGTVIAESGGRDKGATFRVRLPVQSLSRSSRDYRLDHVGIPRGALAGSTVVAVDDDLDTRELLQSVLESAGARVFSAASADEALRACERHRPDALVSDIGMPGRDGYMLLRDVQATLGAGAPRVAVALSAYASANDRERSAEAGYQHHLAKPVDPASLVETLRDLLEATPYRA